MEFPEGRGSILGADFGKSRGGEGLYEKSLPWGGMDIFWNLTFRNYYTEVFRHVVNFLAKWPLATRRLLQQNCCVNLSLKKGHGIELDGYVESEVVQLLKKYASGHTTIAMCERLMANIDMLKLLRGAYMGKEGLMCITLHGTASKHPSQIS